MIGKILNSIPHPIMKMIEVKMMIPHLINEKIKEDETIEKMINNYLKSNEINRNEFFSGTYNYTLKDILYIENIIKVKIINI